MVLLHKRRQAGRRVLLPRNYRTRTEKKFASARIYEFKRTRSSAFEKLTNPAKTNKKFVNIAVFVNVRRTPLTIFGRCEINFPPARTSVRPYVDNSDLQNHFGFVGFFFQEASSGACAMRGFGAMCLLRRRRCVLLAPQCTALRCPWVSALVLPVVRVPSCARVRLVFCLLHIRTCTTNLYCSTVGT